MIPINMFLIYSEGLRHKILTVVLVLVIIFMLLVVSEMINCSKIDKQKLKQCQRTLSVAT